MSLSGYYSLIFGSVFALFDRVYFHAEKLTSNFKRSAAEKYRQTKKSSNRERIEWQTRKSKKAEAANIGSRILLDREMNAELKSTRAGVAMRFH